MGNNRHKAPYSVYECDLLMKIASIILQQKKEVVFSEIENVVIDGGGTIERMFGNRTRDSIERKARDLLQLPKNWLNVIFSLFIDLILLNDCWVIV